MPEAGVNTTAVHVDLKTCPPDGYVEIRQLSYDEMLERRDNAVNVTQKMGIKDADANIRFANKWSNYFTFARCITDHNLTFDGKPIDFSRPQTALAQLDPKIGAEIEKAIDNLNQEQEELEAFTIAPPSFSKDGEDEPKNSSDEVS